MLLIISGLVCNTELIATKKERVLMQNKFLCYVYDRGYSREHRQQSQR